jgi:hypothetical protein
MNNTRLHKNILQYGIVGVMYLFFLWIAYRYLPFTYYFHDEWRQLAHVIIYGVGYEIQGTSIIALLLGSGRIAGTLINNIFYRYFPFNVLPFILFSLIGHFLNSTLVFRITKRIIKQFWPAFFAGLFFAVSFRHEQALSWVGAGVQLIGSLFFLLLSIDFILTYLEKKIKRDIILSVLFFYIAYLFKENVLFFPIVVVILIATRQILTKKVNKIFLFASLVSFILGVPVAFRLFGSDTTNTQGFSGSTIILKQIINSFFYPLVTLGQYVLPYRFIYRAADWVLMMWYPFMNTGGNIESLLHFPLSDMVSLFSSAILLSLIIIVFIRYKKMRFWIYAGGLYYILSFIPIAFHLIHRYDTQIESRYVYTTTPAVGFLFACCIAYVMGLLRKIKRPIGTFVQISALILIGLFLFKDAQVTQREVRVSAFEGQAMTGFITSLKKITPEISKNTVFYFESDRTYFYDNNILPFKLGSGYVLGILYYPDGIVPTASLIKEPLVDFGSEGVAKDDGKTFGYYQNKKTLKKDFIEKQLFSPDQVRAFRFNSGDNSITDITEEIHTYLQSQTASK